jgi:hexosaminidase
MARSLAAAVAALAVAATSTSALTTPDTRFLVWPPARSVTAEGPGASQSFDSVTIALAPGSADLSGPVSARMQRAIDRYAGIIARLSSASSASASSSPLRVSLLVKSAWARLDGNTNYSYTLGADASSSGVVDIACESIYGCIYGLESLTQLLVVDNEAEAAEGGRNALLSLPHAFLNITDAPTSNWRGLMLDSGRRFFPVPVVENLLDTMAANKLNVLHLHASDHCRWGVESKNFPKLTGVLTGVLGGFYTQSDITALIAYAGDRGIRVVPEFDVPGHTHGLSYSGEQYGAVFCEPNDPSRGQLFGDPSNSTLNFIQTLFSEMAALFTDDVFHIGADETSALGPCTVPSTFAVEREILDFVNATLGKRPAGWEEIQFDAGAATNNTLVYSWARHAPFEITATGRNVVSSNSSHYYFTSAAPGGPAGWSNVYADPCEGVPPGELPLCYGGEMSMWADTYCYISQCGASSGSTPVGAALFGPERDAEFFKSIGGMIWPRGYVGASAFWNFNSSVSPSDPAVVAAIWALNDQLAARGSSVCPTNCSCDQTSACGVPYITPTPPAVGTAIMGNVCEGGISVSQRWAFNANGTISLAANTSLCLHDPALPDPDDYPLVLAECAAGSGATVWAHDPVTSEITNPATGRCVDMRDSDFVIGTYACGSGDGLKQPNQVRKTRAWPTLRTSPIPHHAAAVALAVPPPHPHTNPSSRR